jgi:hypothetical protein
VGQTKPSLVLSSPDPRHPNIHPAPKVVTLSAAEGSTEVSELHDSNGMKENGGHGAGRLPGGPLCKQVYDSPRCSAAPLSHKGRGVNSVTLSVSKNL